MALVKFGAGIVGMSGSIGGTTFARNRYGSYARSKTKPVNPNTSNQSAVRAAVSYVTELWHNTLTAAQRTAWGAYAQAVAMTNRLGETTYLTGFNHFVRSNVERQNRSLGTVAAGPTTFALPEQDTLFAVSLSEATQNITVTFDDSQDWCDEDDSYLLLYMGSPQLVTRDFFSGPWLYAGKIDGDSTTPPTSTVDIAASFTATEGQKVFCYARIIRADGRVSEPFYAYCTVAA